MNRLIGEGSTDRLTFGRRPVGIDGANPADSRERSDPERGDSKCRAHLVCSQSREKASASERPVEDGVSTASDWVWTTLPSVLSAYSQASQDHLVVR